MRVISILLIIISLNFGLFAQSMSQDFQEESLNGYADFFDTPFRFECENYN